MIIIIGLGNPGEQYKNTRHNVGFEAIDAFAKENEFADFELDKKANALVLKEGKIILAKPQTFMNKSGDSAKKLALTYKAKAANFVVIHDDVDLPVGKIKIVKERGSAGHKGVESVIKAIGNKGLVRIRIGTAGKKNSDAMDIVLKKFSPEEQKQINKVIDKTVGALDLFIKEGLDKTMNEYNK
jgi:PTH1 family peptidyl-tRNA hydrolase